MGPKEDRRLLDEIRVFGRAGSPRPHKVLLLKVLVELIESNENRENRFYFEEIEPLFLSSLKESFPGRPDSYYESALEYPFFHLQSDGFWNLKIKDGMMDRYGAYEKTRLTKKRLLETVDYGYLDEEVLSVLRNRDARELIRAEIREWLSRNKYVIPERGDAEVVFERTSLFEHEQIALDEFSGLIQNEMRLIKNMMIWDSQTNTYYEYDVIAIGCSGIYVVDLKHWTGDIEIQEYQWRIGRSKYRTDPHINNNFKCKILKGLYEHEFVTYPNIWVESVVVLTNPEATVHNADAPKTAADSSKHNITFASISDLVSFLRRREKSVHVLEDEQVTAITNYLKSLNKPKEEKQYTVDGYETVEYLSQKPDYIEMLARPIDIKGAGLKRLRVFRFTQEQKSERDRFRKMALNTLNAVEQISDKSYVHKVSVHTTESGDIVEISDWSETGTLRDLMSQSKNGLSLEATLSICSKVASALTQAHRKSIIHRAVKPENVLIENGVPKLMNFDLAFQLEDDHLTVLPDPNVVKDDGYVAPEVLFGEDIDESTDFFSLGVIAYQMLTGEKPFKSTRRFRADGGRLSDAHIKKLRESGVPDDLVDGLICIINADRSERVKNTDRFLSALTLQKPVVEDIPNQTLRPGDKFNVWEIIELIGKGKETQIYKARTHKGKTLVLKMFDYETPVERINNEIDMGSQITSPYVVKYDPTPGYWDNKRFCAVMDYIAGESLRRKIESGERPLRPQFEKVARSLMEGIRAMHDNQDEDGEPRPIIHGDIKPDNIIVTPEWNPVLIDLGLAGSPRVEHYHGTPQYIPPYAIIDSDREFSFKCDLYALGITLWEWLFGERPYSNPSVGEKPIIPEVSSEFEDLLPWLTKSIATDPENGFATISDMWNMFTMTEPTEEEIPSGELQDEIAASVPTVAPVPISVTAPVLKPTELFEYNSFVGYLNTLTSVSAGNENAVAENQIKSKYFSKIHVPNPVSDQIYELIAGAKNVILTGNAGDGKTTIAVDIVQKIAGYPVTDIGPKHVMPDYKLTVVKDMSELSKEERVQILKEAYGSEAWRYLIVSNTGTLLESFDRLGHLLQESFDDVFEALEDSKPVPIANERFYLLNIGQLDSIDTACQVLRRMLEPANWEICHQCIVREDCSIHTNVTLLQSDLELVLKRTYYLYKRLYEYGQRLTMRQMTGHLAYALTTGLNCHDISNMSLMARRDNVTKTRFFNNFFGDDGTQVCAEATKLAPVRLIRDAGFGVNLMPKFEREIWLKDAGTQLFGPEARDVYFTINRNHSENSRHQIRRLAYFCGNFEPDIEEKFVTVFLNSPTLMDYLSVTCGESVEIPFRLRKLCSKVVHILQEQFMGLRLPEDSWKQERDLYITLKPPRGNALTQMILARFRQEEFELVVKPRYQCCSTDGVSNKVPYLRYKPVEEVELELDLPFFDYVTRRYEGEITHELSAYYGNRLEDFKGKLLRADKGQTGFTDVLRLLRIRPDRRFEQLVVRVQDDRLDVI